MFGSRANAMNFRNRRARLRPNISKLRSRRKRPYGLVAILLLRFLLTPPAQAQRQGPVRITLDEAVLMALHHNHNMLAIITTIQQAEAEEITANLRPNPTLFADWEYLPLGSPAKQNPGLYSGQTTNDYLKNNTEGDIGLSYLIERGKKRQH